MPNIKECLKSIVSFFSSHHEWGEGEVVPLKSCVQRTVTVNNTTSPLPEQCILKFVFVKSEEGAAVEIIINDVSGAHEKVLSKLELYRSVLGAEYIEKHPGQYKPEKQRALMDGEIVFSGSYRIEVKGQNILINGNIEYALSTLLLNGYKPLSEPEQANSETICRI